MISKGEAELDLSHYGENEGTECFTYQGEIDLKGQPCGYGTAVSE